MNAADYREEARPFLERIHPYAQSPDAFRNRWRLGDAHLAPKGVLAVMALIAVLALARDFRRAQCVLCDEQADSHPLTL